MTNHSIYICCNLGPDNYRFVTDELHELMTHAGLTRRQVFRPGVGQLKDKQFYVNLDRESIDKCDTVWVIGKFGQDCCWEIGYAMGRGKRVVIFRSEINQDDLDEYWMLYAGKELGLLAITTKEEFLIAHRKVLKGEV